MKKLISGLFRLLFLVASVLVGFSIMRVLKKRQLELDEDTVEIEPVKVEKKSSVHRETEKKVKVIPSSEEKSSTVLTFRQQKILNILKTSNFVEMHNLQMSIKGVTERTLRRDLLQLQNFGLIKKIGNTKSVKYQLLNK